MALRDLKLDFVNKKIINEFLKGRELIIQKVVLALQTWAGDWYLDGSIGIPYSLRFENKALLLADIQEVILSVDGVASIQDLDIKTEYENPNKKVGKIFKIYATIITEDSETIILNGLVPIAGVQ